MERLTEKIVCNLPDEVLEKLGIAEVPKEAYEIKETHGATCKETCEEHECSDCPIDKAINKLADYEEAEEKGLLLRLPCKVGDTVYTPCSWGIENGVVGSIEIISDRVFVNNEYGSMIGEARNIFLTKEEAEHALKQMGE